MGEVTGRRSGVYHKSARSVYKRQLHTSERWEHPHRDYWLTHDPGFRAEVSPDIGVYCGELGCVGGTDCADHRQPQPWDLNPLPTDDKPDVLAPMHIIRRRETSTEHGWEYLATGTSFSAPLVTGTLASIFDQLRDDGDGIPRPREVRQAVRTGAKEFDADLGPRYDAEGVLNELRSV